MPVSILDKPQVNINVKAPQSVNFNDEFTINVNISKVDSPALNAKLKMYNNHKLLLERAIGEIDRQSYFLKVKGSDLRKDMNNFEIVVEYSDLEGQQYTESKSFQIKLNELNIWQNILYFILHIFG